MNGWMFEAALKQHHKVSMGIAQKVVEYLPEMHGERWLRCHEVARVVDRVLKNTMILSLPVTWRVVDGKYVGGVAIPADHTWILWSDGIVLDTYAVARYPPVQLVDNNWPTNAHYKEEEECSDIRYDCIEYCYEIACRNLESITLPH